MIKNLLKKFLWNYGIVIHRREPWMENYKWITEYNIRTIIDIGANVGQFINWSLVTFNNPHIYAFEPIHNVFGELKVKFGNRDNIELFNYGIGNVSGELLINVNENSPSSSILDLDAKHIENFDFAINTQKEVIHVRTLDSLYDCFNINSNLLVKIDVQGFEHNVILGANKTLRCAKVIIVELSFLSLYKNQLMFDDIAIMLRDLGFRYKGNLEDQSRDKESGAPMFVDAVFVNEFI
jgi:FkbM family methyltransferase